MFNSTLQGIEDSLEFLNKTKLSPYLRQINISGTVGRKTSASVAALQRFRYLSSSLRSSLLPTYSSRCLLAKSKTCTLGGTSLKEREIIYSKIFSRAIKGIVSVVYRK